MFFSMPKALLEGKKLYLDWSGDQIWGIARKEGFAILDGRYYNTDEEFPAGTGFYVEKGAGTLYEHLPTYKAFSHKIHDTGTLDLSSSTEDDVTVMVWTEEWNGYNAYITIHELQVRDADTDKVLTGIIKGGAVNMITTGTYNDKGTYANPDAFYT